MSGNENHQDIVKLIKKLSLNFKLTALSYTFYLIIPPLTLLNFEEKIIEFQELINSGSNLTEGKISEIINLYLLNGLGITTLLSVLSITMIFLVIQYSRLLTLIELHKLSKTFVIVYIWAIYAIGYSIINAFIVVLNVPKLTRILMEGINIGYLDLEGLYNLDRMFFIAHETLFSISMIVISYTLNEASSSFELMEGIKKPSRVMLIGAILLMVEIYIGGTGIGSVLILISFVFLSRSLKKIF